MIWLLSTLARLFRRRSAPPPRLPPTLSELAVWARDTGAQAINLSDSGHVTAVQFFPADLRPRTEDAFGRPLHTEPETEQAAEEAKADPQTAALLHFTRGRK